MTLVTQRSCSYNVEEAAEGNAMTGLTEERMDGGAEKGHLKHFLHQWK